MKFIDLCAGTGAFTLVLEEFGLECVYANDYVKESETIYNNNFGRKLVLGDLTKIDIKDIPSHDIITSGFPCQPWSLAGERKGFRDKRTNVFWKIIDIINYHKPKVVFIENVKGLVTNKKALKKIFEAFEGYNIDHSVIDTSDITNIPHHRERVYIIATRKDLPKVDFFKDLPSPKTKNIVNFLEKKIDKKYYYSSRFKVWETISDGVKKDITTNTVYQFRRTFVRENKSGLCPTLTANMGGGGHNVPLIKDIKGIRKLTPRECFNLQGFPKGYKLNNLSDTKLYKLVGNSVTIDVVRFLLDRVVKYLN